jgi:hypothetical protein
MNISTHFQSNSRKVEACTVPDAARMGTLPRHFGSRMTFVEHKVYGLMRQFVTDYDGGYLEFFELRNRASIWRRRGPPYADRARATFTRPYAPTPPGLRCASLPVTTHPFERQGEVFSRHFHWLRDYAVAHAGPHRSLPTERTRGAILGPRPGSALSK